MNFIIPMAGRGQRFIDDGYKIPKYLIKVKNKTLLQWSIDSLPLDLATKILFIILQEHEDEYNISSFIRKPTRIRRALSWTGKLRS